METDKRKRWRYIVEAWLDGREVECHGLGSDWFKWQNDNPPAIDSWDDWRIVIKYQAVIDAFNTGRDVQWQDEYGEWRTLNPKAYPHALVGNEKWKWRIIPKFITRIVKIVQFPGAELPVFDHSGKGDLELIFEDTGERPAKLIRATVIK